MNDNPGHLWWMNHAWDERTFGFYDWWNEGNDHPPNAGLDSWIETTSDIIMGNVENPTPEFWLHTHPSADFLVRLSQTTPPPGSSYEDEPATSPLGFSAYETWAWMRGQSTTRDESILASHHMEFREQGIVRTAQWTPEEAEKVAEMLASERLRGRNYKDEVTGRAAISRAIQDADRTFLVVLKPFLSNPHLPCLLPPGGNKENLWSFIVGEVLELSKKNPRSNLHLVIVNSLVGNPCAPAEDLFALGKVMEGTPMLSPYALESHRKHITDHHTFNQGATHRHGGNWYHTKEGYDTSLYSVEQIRSVLLDNTLLPLEPFDSELEASVDVLGESAWELLSNPAREELATEIIREVITSRDPSNSIILQLLLPAIPAVLAKLEDEMMGEGADDVPLEWLMEAMA